LVVWGIPISILAWRSGSVIAVRRDPFPAELGVQRVVFEAALSLSILASLVALIGAPKGSAAENALVTGIFVQCVILFLDKLLAYYLALRKFAISFLSTDSALDAPLRIGPCERAIIEPRCRLNRPARG
jgi:hypothetical protein